MDCFSILQVVHYSVPPHINQAIISFFPHFVAGTPFGPAMGLFMNPYHYTPDIYSGIPGILGAGMPYPGYHGFPFPTPAVHRAPSPNVVTEEDLQKMIQIHRKRRLANEVYRQLKCYLLSSFCSVSV